jgi:hypothetical protein
MIIMPANVKIVGCEHSIMLGYRSPNGQAQPYFGMLAAMSKKLFVQQNEKPEYD